MADRDDDLWNLPPYPAVPADDRTWDAEADAGPPGGPRLLLVLAAVCGLVAGYALVCRLVLEAG